MKRFIPILVLAALMVVPLIGTAQISADATTTFTPVAGGWARGDYHVVEMSDTLTNAEADTIIFNCMRDLKKTTVDVYGTQLSGTLSISVSTYASPTLVTADIDYDNAVISALAGVDGAWAEDVQIPVLASASSNIGPCAVILTGSGTQSSTYRLVYTEHRMHK